MSEDGLLNYWLSFLPEEQSKEAYKTLNARFQAQNAEIESLKELLAIAQIERHESQTREMRLRDALQEISKGKGRFSRDNYEHCRNTIEDMKELASNALSQPAPPIAEILGQCETAMKKMIHWIEYTKEPHLIDTDENPGQAIREALAALQSLRGSK